MKERGGEKRDTIRYDQLVCSVIDIPLAYLDLDYYGDIPEPCLMPQPHHCVIIRGKAEIVRAVEENAELRPCG